MLIAEILSTCKLKVILSGLLISLILHRHYLVIPVEHVATVNDLKRGVDDHQLGILVFIYNVRNY